MQTLIQRKLMHTYDETLRKNTSKSKKEISYDTKINRKIKNSNHVCI